MNSEEVIIDRGRGPEIKGTRITVYSILDYVLEGWHPHRIATFFRIGSRQVEAAIDYIEQHRTEVMADYQKILDRAARGNPPELQAKLDANHERFLELVAKIRQLEEADPEARREKVAALVREYRQVKNRAGADARDNGRQ
jgi:uncharacterized protein (DUF433 family)